MTPDSNIDDGEKILSRLIQAEINDYFISQGRQSIFLWFNMDFKRKLIAGSGGYWADGGNGHALLKIMELRYGSGAFIHLK